MVVDIKINLGHVDVNSLHTEEDIRAAARKLVPIALKEAGEAAAGAAWESIQKTLRGPGFSANNSSAEKRKFIAETAKKYVRDATPASKREVEDLIVKQIRSKKGL